MFPRDLVFLSVTLAWAEALGARDIFIGVNALDYSGYPDCRPEFIEGFAKLANLATKAGAEGEHSASTHLCSSWARPRSLPRPTGWVSMRQTVGLATIQRTGWACVRNM